MREGMHAVRLAHPTLSPCFPYGTVSGTVSAADVGHNRIDQHRIGQIRIDQNRIGQNRTGPKRSPHVAAIDRYWSFRRT